MLCPSCLHPFCFLSPLFNDVYRVPDAFLQRFGQRQLGNIHSAALRVLMQLLRSHSLFRTVAAEGSLSTRLATNLWGQYSCQVNPKIKNSCLEAGVDQIIENMKSLSAFYAAEVSENPVLPRVKLHHG